MKSRVSFNLQILKPEKTFLSAVSAAALYGKGVFTSLAFFNRQPFLWEKHWRRLQKASARLGIDLGDFKEAAVDESLRRLIAENGLENGRARLTFFAESAGKIWDFETARRTGLLITTAKLQTVKDRFLLTLSPFPVNSKSPLAGLKSCNYLEHLLALEEARERGGDEALRLNESGEITAAATANIFWVKDGEIFTPALETGCLAGTTREFLIENFPVRETKAAIGALFEADEIFLTSAGIGVRPADFQNVGGKTSQTAEKFNKVLDLHRFKA